MYLPKLCNFELSVSVCSTCSYIFMLHCSIHFIILHFDFIFLILKIQIIGNLKKNKFFMLNNELKNV